MKTVRLPEPGRGEGEPVRDGRLPAMDGPVVVELHGHRHRYVVRAAPTEHGPVLTDLRVVGDGGALDYDALTPLPLRRLAYAAMQWLSSAGGLFADPGDTEKSRTEPENADHVRRRNKATEELLNAVAEHVTYAVENGLPVQQYVGRKLDRSKPAVARYIARAKAEGFLPDTPLPKVQSEVRKPRTRPNPST